MQVRLTLVVAGLLIASPLFAQTAVEMVRKHIDGLPNGKGAGEVTAQASAAVKETFADHDMVIVRFRQFPVARIMPEGLNASNIYAVTKDGKNLTHLKDVKTLEKFFNANAKPATKEEQTKSVLSAWLTLTQEFHQDGMFKFDVLDKEFAIEGEKARGRIVVMQGGNGELKAELTIKEGKLAGVSEKAAIRPGPRPICQATKLLDADPIVRRIAEQDLLIMGLLARDYLMEQREKATPELRRAIDRVWAQIQRNGW